jgi:hypothetical protein
MEQCASVFEEKITCSFLGSRKTIRQVDEPIIYGNEPIIWPNEPILCQNEPIVFSLTVSMYMHFRFLPVVKCFDSQPAFLYI